MCFLCWSSKFSYLLSLQKRPELTEHSQDRCLKFCLQSGISRTAGNQQDRKGRVLGGENSKTNQNTLHVNINQPKTPGSHETSKVIQGGKKPNVLPQLYRTANPSGEQPTKIPEWNQMGNHPLLLWVSHTVQIICCTGRRSLAADTSCGSLWFLTFPHQGDQWAYFRFDAA